MPGFRVFGEKLIYATPGVGGGLPARIFTVESRISSKKSSQDHFIYILQESFGKTKQFLRGGGQRDGQTVELCD